MTGEEFRGCVRCVCHNQQLRLDGSLECGWEGPQAGWTLGVEWTLG